MATTPIPFRFNGGLVSGTTTGQQSEAFDRVLTRVQLSIDGNPPTADLQIQVRIAGVAAAQIFTLAAGTRYADIPVIGSGLSVPSGAFIDWIVTDVGQPGVSDLNIIADLDSAIVTSGGSNPDCGLGVLSEVKAFVLPTSLQSDTDYDTALALIAKGVARKFDRHCNRKFVRAANTFDEFSGDRRHLYVTHYPLESVTKVELRTTLQDGLQLLPDATFNTDATSGLVFLAADQGWSWTAIRVTYTGGYWYDATPDQSDTLPAGATQLEDDLKLAWLEQIAHIWSLRDNLGLGIVDKPSARAKLDQAQLTASVKEALGPYVRYANS